LPYKGGLQTSQEEYSQNKEREIDRGIKIPGMPQEARAMKKAF